LKEGKEAGDGQEKSKYGGERLINYACKKGERRNCYGLLEEGRKEGGGRILFKTEQGKGW